MLRYKRIVLKTIMFNKKTCAAAANLPTILAYVTLTTGIT
jgi:hypothetical protein